MTNLRVSAQRSCTAAWHVCQSKIECGVFTHSRRIGNAAFHVVRRERQGASAIAQTAVRQIPMPRSWPSGLRSARMSVLPPGAAHMSRMLVAVFGGASSQLTDQLRSFVLHADTAFTKGLGRRQIARIRPIGLRSSKSPGAMRMPACVSSSSTPGLSKRTDKVGWDLAVAADRHCRFETVETRPSARLSTPDAPEPTPIHSGESSQIRERCVATRQAAQHGVDQSGGEAMARLLRQLHALVDRGCAGMRSRKRIWKAPRRRAISTSASSLAFGRLSRARISMIKANLPAEHAKHQSGGQIAIRMRSMSSTLCFAANCRSDLFRVRRPCRIVEGGLARG